MNLKNLIDELKETREDATKERNDAEANGNSDFAFWDGYICAMDQAIFLLEQKVEKKKAKKASKKEKK